MKAIDIRSHLHQRNGIYYFRIAYPRSLAKILGRSAECKLSLKTTSIYDAQRISNYMGQYAHLVFSEAERMTTGIATDQIKKLVNSYFEKKLLEYSEQLILMRTLMRDEGDFDPNEILGAAHNSRERMSRLKTRLALHDFDKQHERDAETLLREHNLSILSTVDRMELCQLLVRANYESERINHAYLSGTPSNGKIQDKYFEGSRNFFDKPDGMLYFQTLDRVSLPDGDIQPLTENKLGVTVANFLDFKKLTLEHEGRKTYKLKEYKGFFDRLTDILGEGREMKLINRKDCQKISEYLLCFPKNYRENFGRKSIQLMEVLKGDKEYDKIGPAQAKKIWDVYKSFFAWCVERDIIPSSPAEGIKLSGKSHNSDDRDSFSSEQLKKIFNSPLFTGRKFATRCPWQGPDAGREGVIVRDVQYWLRPQAVRQDFGFSILQMSLSRLPEETRFPAAVEP